MMTVSANEKIPIFTTAPEVELLLPKLQAAVTDVMRAGRFINGPEVKKFEKEVGSYLGATHALGLNSGTDALVIALKALGIGPGDEVITSAFSFFATAEAIGNVGATPVLADIDPKTFNISVSDARKRVTPRTKAIIPVHLFGLASDMDAIMALAEENKLRIVEDVAQAFGGTYGGKKLGTIGDIGCYSFFPTKNLGAYGDGGLITCRHERDAHFALKIRAHGGLDKYSNEMYGYNSRLDTMQAAILSVKLPFIDEYCTKRRAVAARYDAAFRGISGITAPPGEDKAVHVYHQYTVRIGGGNRDLVKGRLAENGIETMVYYPTPINRLPIYAAKNWSCPESEKAAQEVLSLPIWPQLPVDVQDRVISSVLAALRA